MNKFSRRVTQIHGITLVILTVPLFFYINLVPSLGVGPYAFMKDDFWAIGGFAQAYMLMFVFGISIFVGSSHSTSRVWNRIGALPHLIFIVLYVMNFAGLYQGLNGLAVGGFILHLLWASLEVVAALGLVPYRNKSISNVAGHYS